MLLIDLVDVVKFLVDDLHVLMARGLGGALLLHVRLDLPSDGLLGGGAQAAHLGDVGTRELLHRLGGEGGGR